MPVYMYHLVSSVVGAEEQDKLYSVPTWDISRIFHCTRYRYSSHTILTWPSYPVPIMRLFYLLPLCAISSATRPTNISVIDVSRTTVNCPYSISAQFGGNISTLAIKFTSKDSTLIKYGDPSRECFTSVTYTHDGFNGSLSAPSVDMRGYIRLSSGLRTKIETSLLWDDDAKRQQNFTTLRIPGAAIPQGTQYFGSHLYNSTDINYSTCNSTASQDPYEGKIRVRSGFLIEKRGNASSDAIGELGPEFTLLLNLLWNDGCAEF
ncbi:hypothetical protein DM02DRAFT_626323 [Periconia macrospinosa]|uniref:Uncharacterized protein n=1 Tax=Periconia macrospinosa TaxID=97972 RepID=A0A2V1DXW6_9PLEO|nr:hypothetical protein DM02DRAFT_626323 [Periconia macrospinosa]